MLAVCLHVQTVRMSCQKSRGPLAFSLEQVTRDSPGALPPSSFMTPPHAPAPSPAGSAAARQSDLGRALGASETACRVTMERSGAAVLGAHGKAVRPVGPGPVGASSDPAAQFSLAPSRLLGARVSTFLKFRSFAPLPASNAARGTATQGGVAVPPVAERGLVGASEGILGVGASEAAESSVTAPPAGL